MLMQMDNLNVVEIQIEMFLFFRKKIRKVVSKKKGIYLILPFDFNAPL